MLLAPVGNKAGPEGFPVLETVKDPSHSNPQAGGRRGHDTETKGKKKTIYMT